MLAGSDGSAVPDPNAFADLQPNESFSSAMHGNQQGCKVSKKAYTTHSMGVAGTLARGDKPYSAPKKTFSANPTCVVDEKVQTVNSFSVLGKVHGNEIKSAPPVKRTRKQTQKAIESMAQGNKGLGMETATLSHDSFLDC